MLPEGGNPASRQPTSDTTANSMPIPAMRAQRRGDVRAMRYSSSACSDLPPPTLTAGARKGRQLAAADGAAASGVSSRVGAPNLKTTRSERKGTNCRPSSSRLPVLSSSPKARTAGRKDRPGTRSAPQPAAELRFTQRCPPAAGETACRRASSRDVRAWCVAGLGARRAAATARSPRCSRAGRRRRTCPSPPRAR